MAGKAVGRRSTDSVLLDYRSGLEIPCSLSLAIHSSVKERKQEASRSGIFLRSYQTYPIYASVLSHLARTSSPCAKNEHIPSSLLPVFWQPQELVVVLITAFHSCTMPLVKVQDSCIGPIHNPRRIRATIGFANITDGLHQGRTCTR